MVIVVFQPTVYVVIQTATAYHPSNVRRILLAHVKLNFSQEIVPNTVVTMILMLVASLYSIKVATIAMTGISSVQTNVFLKIKNVATLQIKIAP